MGAITLGVAALVAINSFRGNIVEAIRSESRALLGADLEVHSSRRFPDPVQGILDSAAAAGVPRSTVTSLPSMARSPVTEMSRLVHLRAIEGDFPYYGEIGTDPTDAWGRLQEGRHAVVEATVTAQLDIAVGDSVTVGEAAFQIIGIITSSPGEVSFQSAVGPRIYIPAAYLEETGLIQFGSLVRYQTYLQIEDNPTLQDFLNRYNSVFEDNQVGYNTVAEQVENLTEAFENMTRFLGLVGLTALLLGGVGVASAVHVYTKEKLNTVAVLRCLGATQRTVFTAYLVQAAALGFLGAAAGVILGLAVQRTLPNVLGDLLPMEVSVAVDWLAVVAGLVIGVWVASVFALLPLVSVRDIPPLRALRRELEEVPRRFTVSRGVAGGALLASVLVISLWQAPLPALGWVYAGGIVGTVVLLWVTARLLMRMTRRHFPKRARYVIRQGVANLFRPQNQTAAVIIALGFGTFLIATIYLVQRNILEPFTIDSGAEAPNLFLFDIQHDQQEGVADLLREHGAPPLQLTPLIPARLSAINGRPVDEILADSSGPVIPRWALRREYRHTYRDTLAPTEELIAGEWWDTAAPTTSGLPQVSIEQDIADELHVGIGDRVTWDFQGIPVEVEISSVRRVNWARFELNFFFVFEPRALAAAPPTIIAFTRIDDMQQRANFQRDLVRQYPNVSVADLALLQEALESVLDKVTLGVRFMALFSIASGIIVLFGAIATSRFHRIREGVLLKTLGATRKQIGHILLTEYLTLGTLAGLTGILLAGLSAWGLVRFMFELDFHLPSAPLAALWLGVAVLTAGIGLLNGRDVLKKPPLAVIREIAE
jgi:putative ABC transport system permease protein